MEIPSRSGGVPRCVYSPRVCPAGTRRGKPRHRSDTETNNMNIATVTMAFHYRPQTRFAKVMFSQVFVCPQGEGSVSRGSLSGGVSVRGKGLCPEGLVSKGVCVQGGLCQGDVRLVLILLECIFVFQSRMLNEQSDLSSHYSVCMVVCLLACLLVDSYKIALISNIHTWILNGSVRGRVSSSR